MGTDIPDRIDWGNEGERRNNHLIVKSHITQDQRDMKSGCAIHAGNGVGNTQLFRDGLFKAAQGMTTIEEVLRVVSE